MGPKIPKKKNADRITNSPREVGASDWRPAIKGLQAVSQNDLAPPYSNLVIKHVKAGILRPAVHCYDTVRTGQQRTKHTRLLPDPQDPAPEP